MISRSLMTTNNPSPPTCYALHHKPRLSGDGFNSVSIHCLELNISSLRGLPTRDRWRYSKWIWEWLTLAPRSWGQHVAEERHTLTYVVAVVGKSWNNGATNFVDRTGVRRMPERFQIDGRYRRCIGVQDPFQFWRYGWSKQRRSMCRRRRETQDRTTRSYTLRGICGSKGRRPRRTYKIPHRRGIWLNLSLGKRSWKR